MGIGKVSICILLVSLFSCEIFLKKDQEISITQENYDGDNLKLGRYYFKSGDMVYSYYLFGNGLILNIGAFDLKEWDSVKNKQFKNQNWKKASKYKYNWGLYTIRGMVIKFERWYPSEKPYKTGIREGYILNDSTFVINKVIFSHEERETKEVYHFKELKNKPDSITNFFN